MRQLLMAFGLFAMTADSLRADVRDRAELFRPETRTKAEQIIRQVENRHGRRVVVETFPGIPDELRAEFEKANKQGRGAVGDFYRDWARSRSADLGLRGIYILVSKKPGRVQIHADQTTERIGFTAQAGDKLMQILRSQFQDERFDDGLIAGLNYVADTLARGRESGKTKTGNTPVSENNSADGFHLSPGGMICAGIGVVLILWMIVGMIRPASGGGPAAAGVGGAAGGGGGGFLPMFLGGMFGTMAGHYLYNSFFGGHTSQSDGSSGGDQTAHDYSSGDSVDAGGDFGGSDFGGGDYGGGDFGGGDF